MSHLSKPRLFAARPVLGAVAGVFLFSSFLLSEPLPQAHRLILKDGTYQAITKYEIHGDRVRYFSAERGEWEEVPKDLIDWDATKKFEEGSLENAPSPEAIELDKEIAADAKAERERTPEVAPRLHLPDDGGIYLLDTFDNHPQLDELQQSGADVGESSKTANILRAVINPMSGMKQAIELPGAHAKVQSHTGTPSIYVNVENDNGTQSGAPATAKSSSDAPPPLLERFKIIRIDVKGNKRTAGSIQVAVGGKTKTDERMVPTTSAAMSGGWIKLAPTEPLAPGEYAVAEILGKEGMNLYVWDFGVNPAAPANAFAWNPEPVDAPKSEQEPQLQKRDKQ
jgi:hypothetical protein